MNSANKEWKDERHWRIHRERSLYTDEDAYSQLLDKIKQWRKTDLQTWIHRNPSCVKVLEKTCKGELWYERILSRRPVNA